MASAPKKAHVAPVAEAHVASAPAVELAIPALPEIAKATEASVTEIQGQVRSVFEKGLNETRASYAKAKSAADEAATALEASLATAKSGVAEINSKALEAVRAAADAQFDFVKSILGVKTVADYVTLHSEFTRKQFETLTGTTKEISALAQKVATDSVEPIKAQVVKTLKIAG